MKYAIVIPDGCADEPQPSLGGRTPLQAAQTPNMDRLARMGQVGRADNVPSSLTSASDVATLSLLGYDPRRYYTGRAPLEAAALGIDLGPNDWAVRCNLVTIEDGRMVDFTAGHIPSSQGRELIAALQAGLGRPGIEFFPGVSYRNVLVIRGRPDGPFAPETRTQPPHDIPDQPVDRHLPHGPGSELLIDLMNRSQSILADHPVNRRRRDAGDRTATQIWLWGQGRAPQLPSFERQHNVRGCLTTGVDLIRGIAILIGWDRLEVPGVTDYLDTDYTAQGDSAVKALQRYDLVCVHVEAPDEASHEGRLDAKIDALEQTDRHIVGPLMEHLATMDSWRILVSPDHPTPVRTRAHGYGHVPFVIAGTRIHADGAESYDEPTAASSRLVFGQGHELLPQFLQAEL